MFAKLFFANVIIIIFFAKVLPHFKTFQRDRLVDVEKCCKTRIFLQRSVPIQPKTSNILPPKECAVKISARAFQRAFACNIWLRYSHQKSILSKIDMFLIAIQIFVWLAQLQCFWSDGFRYVHKADFAAAVARCCKPNYWCVASTDCWSLQTLAILCFTIRTQCYESRLMRIT